jgi:hypothetical protein
LSVHPGQIDVQCVDAAASQEHAFPSKTDRLDRNRRAATMKSKIARTACGPLITGALAITPLARAAEGNSSAALGRADR